METCWTVIARAARGEALARSVFTRSYLRLIRAYLVERWRRGPLADQIDDAVQDVFLECFRTGNALGRAGPEHGSFRSFLLAVVRNVARRAEEKHARHGREEPTGSAVGELPSQESRLSAVFDRHWAETLMRDAARLQHERALTADQGARLRVELLKLRFREGLPIRDIAARWDMDVAVVHRAYAKARAEFHSCLREVVAFHAVRTEADCDAECKRVLDLLG
jgi:RNA polymerase sigma factor (sigma-70 family)